jgi:hypothetical protein
MTPKEFVKLIPVAIEHLTPVEKKLMQREIHRGVDPAKEHLKAVHHYLADQEFERLKKERGLK